MILNTILTKKIFKNLNNFYKNHYYDKSKNIIKIIVGLLVQATTYPFDNRFLNFEDPGVLKQMIGEGYQNHWKEVYGFDFAEISRDSSPVRDHSFGWNKRMKKFEIISHFSSEFLVLFLFLKIRYKGKMKEGIG